MRIIAGTAKGRKLQTPKNDNVRPTTDRVRESLFSIMGSFEDCVVWDAFAGTGALGCEALSRGADFVYFSDSSRPSIELVRENIGRVTKDQNFRVIHAPAERAIAELSHDPDIIFLDPPYASGLLESVVDAIARASAIGSGALLVCEQGAEEPPIQHDSFEMDDQRLFGSIRITFLVKRGVGP